MSALRRALARRLARRAALVPPARYAALDLIPLRSSAAPPAPTPDPRPPIFLDPATPMHPLIPPATPLATPSPAHAPLELLIAAWLQAKAGRSGSPRTGRAYADTLASFRGALALARLDLLGDPAAVALIAQGWAALGDPSPATFNQRLAIASSFYLFARTQGSALENPIARVERRVLQRYAGAHALDVDQLRRQLEQIDRASLEGQRDYCLIAVGLQTGRRVAELAGLRWGDVTIMGAAITLDWRRTKGGKAARDTLPVGLSRTLASFLRAHYGDQVRTLGRDAAIWPSYSTANAGAPISTQAIRDICGRRIGTTRVHALRHTFARTMERTGATLSEIQARLGHSNAATTGIYLGALMSNENPHADALAALLGLD